MKGIAIIIVSILALSGAFAEGSRVEVTTTVKHTNGSKLGVPLGKAEVAQLDAAVNVKVGDPAYQSARPGSKPATKPSATKPITNKASTPAATANKADAAKRAQTKPAIDQGIDKPVVKTSTLPKPVIVVIADKNKQQQITISVCPPSAPLNKDYYLSTDYWQKASADQVRADLRVQRFNVKDTSDLSYTPLMLAASYSPYPEVIRVLIAAGAKPSDRDRDGLSPLMMAAAYALNPEIVLALLQGGANVNDRDHAGITPLMYAARSNINAKITKYLIGELPKEDGDESIPDPNCPPGSLTAQSDVNARDKNGLTPLMYAARSNPNPEVIKLIIEAGVARSTLGSQLTFVEARDNLQWTALMHAANSNSNPAVVKTLVKSGANINDTAPSGETVLMIATINNLTPEVTEQLLKLGADISIKNNRGLTAFDYAKLNERLTGTQAFWIMNNKQYELNGTKTN